MAYVVHTFDEVEAYLRDLAEHADNFLHRVPSPTSRTPFSTSTC